jgi:hypothetical protein
MHLRYYRDHLHLDDLVPHLDVVHLHLLHLDHHFCNYLHLLVHLHHLDEEQNLDDLHLVLHQDVVHLDAKQNLDVEHLDVEHLDVEQ